MYINRQNQSQPENCENRNVPDLVQAFLKKWWFESDFKVPNLPLSLRLKAKWLRIIIFKQKDPISTRRQGMIGGVILKMSYINHFIIYFKLFLMSSS
jgi:hypothetical protein